MGDDLASYLQDENLVYYRNIAYLKELTKRATSLLSRSNAMYSNILNDEDIAVRVKGLSIDSDTLLAVGDESKCRVCGLYHAADFCIVQQIHDAEMKRALQNVQQEPSQDYISKETGVPQIRQKELKAADEPKLPSMTSKQSYAKVLEIYKNICNRQGRPCNTKILLDSPAGTGLHNFEPTSEAGMKYREIEIECEPPTTPVFDPICKEYSDDVKKKMEKIVELLPPCEALGNDDPKEWKGIFKNSKRMKRDFSRRKRERRIEVDHTQMPGKLICQCAIDIDCDCSSVMCSIPPAKRKKCPLLRRGDTNYLIKIRNKMDTRRRGMQEERRILNFEKSRKISISSSCSPQRRRSSEFLRLGYEEQLKKFQGCMEKILQNADIEDIDRLRSYIEKVAQIGSPNSMIRDREFSSWLEGYKEEENSDDADSRDSDVGSDASDSSELSDAAHSRGDQIDYRERPMSFTRIPFAEEVHELTNVLFDKVMVKYEKSVRKNLTDSGLLSYTPTLHFIVNKVAMRTKLTTDSIHHRTTSYFRSNRLIPFSVRKRSKIKQLDRLTKRTYNVRERRKYIQGIQLGKHFKLRRKSFKFSKEGNYIGFTPKERQLLRKTESQRFKTYDLVNDTHGRILTKKTIHNDYRLLRNLFEEPSPSRRMSLIDKEMKQRLALYKNAIRGREKPRLSQQETEPSCSDLDHISISRKFVKDEAVRVQSFQDKDSISTRQGDDRFSSWTNSKSPFSNGYNSRSESMKGLKTANVSAVIPKAKESKSVRVDRKKIDQNALLGAVGELEGSSSGRLEKSEVMKIPGQQYTGKSMSPEIPFPPSNKLPAAQVVSKRNEMMPEQKLPSVLGGMEKKADIITSRQQLPRPSPSQGVTKLSGGSLEQSARSVGLERRNEITGSGRKPVSNSVTPETPSESKSSANQSNKIMPLVRSLGNEKLSPKTIPGSASQYSVASSKLSQVVRRERQHSSASKALSTNKSGSTSLYESSSRRVREKKGLDMLGPTKKRSFGIDIGQGINYVQYLKENAADADEDKQRELINLMIVPREKKKVVAVKKTESEILNKLQQDEKADREKIPEVERSLSKNKQSLYVSEYQVEADKPTKNKADQIKTLDQIYKEVHGINKNNTPARLVENDYQYESLKRQQLRKHKLQ